jgi:hypothetical protein
LLSAETAWLNRCFAEALSAGRCAKLHLEVILCSRSKSKFARDNQNATNRDMEFLFASYAMSSSASLITNDETIATGLGRLGSELDAEAQLVETQIPAADAADAADTADDAGPPGEPRE